MILKHMVFDQGVKVFDKGVKAWLQTGADEEICLNEVQAKLPILRSLRLFFTPFFFDMKPLFFDVYKNFKVINYLLENFSISH